MRGATRVGALVLAAGCAFGTPVVLAGPAAAESRGTVTSLRPHDVRRPAPPVVAKKVPVRRTPTAADRYERRLLELTNSARRARGLKPLVVSGCATPVAGRWADALARSGGLRHNDMRALARRCGARAAAENVAFAHGSPDVLFALWMASPAHRATVLRRDARSVAFGAARRADGRWYAVQNVLRA